MLIRWSRGSGSIGFRARFLDTIGSVGASGGLDVCPGGENRQTHRA